MSRLMLLDRGQELSETSVVPCACDSPVRVKLLEALPPFHEADILRLSPAWSTSSPRLCRTGEGFTIETGVVADGREVIGAITGLERGRAVLCAERGLGRVWPQRYWSAAIDVLEVLRRFRHPWTPPLFQGTSDALLAGVRDKYDAQLEAVQYGAFATGELADIERELILQHVVPGGRVLDIGCGGGREALGFARLGYRVVGIDVAPRMVEAARGSAVRLGIAAEFRVQTVTELDERGVYNGAFFAGSLHHIPGRAVRIETLRRVRIALEPEGVLILMVQYRERLGLISRSRLVDAVRRLGRSVGLRALSEPGDGYMREVSPGSDPERACFFHHYADPAEIRGELEAAGFVTQEVSSRWWVCRPARLLC